MNEKYMTRKHNLKILKDFKGEISLNSKKKNK